MTGQIISIGITIAVLSIAVAVALIREKRRHSLFPDDGFVWNTEIERRMKEEKDGKVV